MANPKYWFLGDYPDQKERDWTDSLQGVTHNQEHWIFAQKTKLFKFHVSQDLGIVESADAVMVQNGVPAELASMGHDHFCDMDYVGHEGGGFLLVPLHKDSGAAAPDEFVLAVFADDGAGGPFEYVGHDVLPFKVGWCAVSPRDFLIHTSRTSIPKSRPWVERFQLNWPTLLEGYVELSDAGHIRLHDAKDRAVSLGKWLQGGTFYPDGSFALQSGRIWHTNADRGIRVFNPGGTLVRTSTIHRPDTPGKLFFEFHPKAGGQGQEPEGLTFWDTGMSSAGGHSRSGGQLHVNLLDKEAGTDGLWFKHYRLDPVPEPHRPVNYSNGVLRLPWPLDPNRQPGLVGNRRSKEFHSLQNRQANCQIDEIKDAEQLSSAAEAADMGYDGCAYCLPGSHTR